MMKAARIFLQAAVVLLGAGVLALMLWVPPHEGRNVNAALFAVYFKDPFLACAYIGSIPFFSALYQAFRVLGYIGRNELFLPRTVRTLRTIRYCALATAGIVAAASAYVRITAGGNDDPAGFVMPGVIAVFASLVAAAAAAVFEDVVRNAMQIGSGNGPASEG
ncbi:MAG: DUF2975 domain-containing protein [Elusimicrobia bacterium]|nr:DUF2975 domain-containing protein [Elusimicrobiota bacterium]